MNDKILVTVEGEVERPRQMTMADFLRVAAADQIDDVSQLIAGRQGSAVRLEGLLDLVGVKPTARYLGLHSSTDDFHASIPLDAVRQQAVLIYRLGDQPLPVAAGGPTRFYIPDHAACHADEVDECANVKFVDRIELTATRGFDNRPADDEEHERLHREQG